MRLDPHERHVLANATSFMVCVPLGGNKFDKRTFTGLHAAHAAARVLATSRPALIYAIYRTHQAAIMLVAKGAPTMSLNFHVLSYDGRHTRITSCATLAAMQKHLRKAQKADRCFTFLEAGDLKQLTKTELLGVYNFLSGTPIKSFTPQIGDPIKATWVLLTRSPQQPEGNQAMPKLTAEEKQTAREDAAAKKAKDAATMKAERERVKAEKEAEKAAAKAEKAAAKAAKTTEVKAPKDMKLRKDPLAEGRPVRAGTSLALLIQTVTGGHLTLDEIVAKMGLEKEKVYHRLNFVLNHNCGIGFDRDADGRYTLLFPADMTLETAIKEAPAAPTEESKAAAKAAKEQEKAATKAAKEAEKAKAKAEKEAAKAAEQAALAEAEAGAKAKKEAKNEAARKARAAKKAA